MGLFSRHLFTSLSKALAAPTACYRLHLQVNIDQLRAWGPLFPHLTRLQELRLHGQYVPDEPQESAFPEEFRQLRTLRKVSLLNLPVTFPSWVRYLPELRVLDVRGTDTAYLPEWIAECRALHTLRVENCALQVLPLALRQMHHLRHVSFSDTELAHVEAAHFPQQLLSLDLGGAHRYPPTDLERLRQELRQTRINPKHVNY
ncbi:MAG TPA: hypothetical protein VF690_19805 [Hymenobacter sp.]|jgi:Leucine-rich repeat (LRR) protein